MVLLYCIHGTLLDTHRCIGTAILIQLSGSDSHLMKINTKHFEGNRCISTSTNILYISNSPSGHNVSSVLGEDKEY